MSYKKINWILFIISLIISGIIFVNSIFTPTGTFIGFFSGSVAIIAFILLFFNEELFVTWGSFTILFILAAYIITLFFPDVSGGFVGFDKEIISILLAGFFLIISVGIIIWKSIRLKKQNK